MHKRNMAVAAFLISIVMGMVAPLAAAWSAEDAPRISKEEVRTLLGNPGVIILDARTGSSWSLSVRKIKGAVRVDPADVNSWAGGLPKDKKIVVYCSRTSSP
jgi:hypothetical protein